MTSVLVCIVWPVWGFAMISRNIGRGPKFERPFAALIFWKPTHGRGPFFSVLVFGLWGPLNCSLPEKRRKGRFAGTDWLGSPRGHDTSLFQRQTNKIPPSSFGIDKWTLATLHSSFCTRIKPMAISLMDLTWRCHVMSWVLVNFQITDPDVTFTLADNCKMCCKKQKLQTSNLKRVLGI